jgi:hypothetical protein
MVLGAGITAFYIALGGGAAAVLSAGIRHITRDGRSRAEQEPLMPTVFVQIDPPRTDNCANYKRALFRSEATRQYF